MQNAFHTLYKAMSNKNENFQRLRDKGDTQGQKRDRQTRKEPKRKLYHLDKIKRWVEKTCSEIIIGHIRKTNQKTTLLKEEISKQKAQ
jgi:hypothetical protein